jgi:folate-dependent phosphoribosylglycinamide formyltransferase PurN
MWVALFSNSGSELGAICDKLNKKPDVVFCDKRRVEWHSSISNDTILKSHNSIVKSLSILPSDTLVTLHGYLRLIPQNAISDRMYNVHPGDIVKYPELKGIHPQAKALELGLSSTGVVIHEVTPEVDNGKIISSAQYTIDSNETKYSLINNLRDLSIDLWCDFLRGKVW